MMQQFRSNSYLFGGNAPYVEELYEAYLDNPGSVPDNWRSYFDALQNVPAGDGTDQRESRLDARAAEIDLGAFVLDSARLDAHGARASLALHADAVVDLEREGPDFIATFASGARLQARAVVLALGNPPAALPGSTTCCPSITSTPCPFASVPSGAPTTSSERP